MINYMDEPTYLSANNLSSARMVMVPDRVVLDWAHSISSIRKILVEYIRLSALLALFNLGQDRTERVGFQLQ